MKKNAKTPTKTLKKSKDDKGSQSKRKNTTSTTRNTDRQRSGSNGPQQGSH